MHVLLYVCCFSFNFLVLRKTSSLKRAHWPFERWTRFFFLRRLVCFSPFIVSLRPTTTNNHRPLHSTLSVVTAASPPLAAHSPRLVPQSTHAHPGDSLCTLNSQCRRSDGFCCCCNRRLHAVGRVGSVHCHGRRSEAGDDRCAVCTIDMTQFVGVDAWADGVWARFSVRLLLPVAVLAVSALSIDGELTRGQDVRTQNVMAVVAIANILKTSLGQRRRGEEQRWTVATVAGRGGQRSRPFVSSLCNAASQPRPRVLHVALTVQAPSVLTRCWWTSWAT